MAQSHQNQHNLIYNIIYVFPATPFTKFSVICSRVQDVDNGFFENFAQLPRRQQLLQQTSRDQAEESLRDLVVPLSLTDGAVRLQREETFTPRQVSPTGDQPGCAGCQASTEPAHFDVEWHFDAKT